MQRHTAPRCCGCHERLVGVVDKDGIVVCACGQQQWVPVAARAAVAGQGQLFDLGSSR